MFDHVDFGYTPDKEVLHDITLLCRSPARSWPFVGATGAGKTTITNLVNRFYDIADGKIRYDGISINDIKQGLICAAASASCFRTPTSSPAPSRKTSATAIRTRPMTTSHRGGKARQRRSTSSARLPRWLRHRAHRATAAGLTQGQRQLLRHRPRGRGRPAGHDPRRGDHLHRHPHRGALSRPAWTRLMERPHRVRHRAPALHGPQLPTSIIVLGPRPHHRARRATKTSSPSRASTTSSIPARSSLKNFRRAPCMPAGGAV